MPVIDMCQPIRNINVFSLPPPPIPPLFLFTFPFYSLPFLYISTSAIFIIAPPPSFIPLKASNFSLPFFPHTHLFYSSLHTYILVLLLLQNKFSLSLSLSRSPSSKLLSINLFDIYIIYLN